MTRRHETTTPGRHHNTGGGYVDRHNVFAGTLRPLLVDMALHHTLVTGSSEATESSFETQGKMRWFLPRRALWCVGSALCRIHG